MSCVGESAVSTGVVAMIMHGCDKVLPGIPQVESLFVVTLNGYANPVCEVSAISGMCEPPIMLRRQSTLGAACPFLPSSNCGA